MRLIAAILYGLLAIISADMAMEEVGLKEQTNASNNL